MRLQLCTTCGANIADQGHFPDCALIARPEPDPRYDGLGDLMVESISRGRVSKTPKTPNPDYLPDGPTREWPGKGRAA
jgi:hypothetical protein